MSNPWITDHSSIKDFLYNLDSHQTFAIRTKESWGPMIKYVQVTGGSYPDSKNYSSTSLAEKYDTILECKISKSPSDDFTESGTMSYEPNENTVYWKRGPGRVKRIEAVAADAMDVIYESAAEIAIECTCGQVTRVNGSYPSPSPKEELCRDDSGNLVTPCCFSKDWTTKLVDSN